MNFCVRISFHFSFLYTWVEFLGQKFSFLRNCQTVSQSSCTMLPFHQQYAGFKFLRVLINTCHYLLFKILFIYFQKGEGREKERERNTSVWLLLKHPPPGTQPTTQACAPTGNWTGGPLVCSPALDPLSHSSQGCYYLLLFQVHNLFVTPFFPLTLSCHQAPNHHVSAIFSISLCSYVIWISYRPEISYKGTDLAYLGFLSNSKVTSQCKG